MSDFFTNLLDRHLGTCDTIRPRIPGRFEMDSSRVAAASHDEGISQIESESDQPSQLLQPSREIFYPRPKKTASEMNSQESMANNRNYPVEPQSTFSVDAPKIATHESDSTGSKDFSSSSLQKENNVSAQSGLPDPEKPNDSQGLDIDRYSHLISQQPQHAQAEKTNLVDDEQKTFNDKRVSINKNESYEVARDNHSLPTPPAGEQHPENELNHRINAMLQGLADTHTPAPSMTEPAPGDRGSDNNESLASLSHGKKSSVLDVAVTPLETTPSVNRQTPREEKKHSSDNDNLRRDSQLDAPIWLPEIETRLSQLQPAEIKTEPVINVTIGRVEVRAVQPETPQQVKRQKKPLGVMSLDDYLRQRKHGKQT